MIHGRHPGAVDMCVKCQGWSDEDLRRDRLRTIERHGWSITGVYGDEEGPPFAYTVGLTRYDGHPELLVSGLPTKTAARFLNSFGEQVRRGARYMAGTLLKREDGHRWQFVPVADPLVLVHAQDTYASAEAGYVPGLQVIWSDCDGRWPWEPEWTTALGTQELYGQPTREYP